MGASEASIGDSVQTCAAHLQDLDRGPVSTTGNSITHSRGERSGSDRYVEDGDAEIETGMKEETGGAALWFWPSHKGGFRREKQTYLDPGRPEEPVAETTVSKDTLFSVQVGEGVLRGGNSHVKGNMTRALFWGETNGSAQRWHWFLHTTKSHLCFTGFVCTTGFYSLFGFIPMLYCTVASHIRPNTEI